jgi:hypothetical protein
MIIKYGLARLDICPYTDQEFDSLPHVFLTPELEWDPLVLDDNDIDHQLPDIDFLTIKSIDEYDHFRHCVNVHHLSFFERQDGTDV